ncbi:hypothetical protein AQ730_04745 [Burkholderia pseudomallei]|nr:hypothetical protein AQ708_04160 [Burkholderia pseudomallei]OMQ89693.1 hypothetical protein AQ714_22010 [Burkholderia pseudomallei]OMR76733.1 hypothetical protein AQ730_04745 [Burkholderia pseudomallei]
MLFSPFEKPGSPSKSDNCDRSLERYDAISDLTELVIPGFVHHVGHPINQHANAGFNRRRKVRSVGDNSRPSIIDRTGRKEVEKSAACPASTIP